MTCLTTSALPLRALHKVRRPSRPIRPSSPRPQRRDCQGRLLAALQKIAGPGCTVEEARQRPWCSATFVGAQHGIVLRLAGAEAMDRARALAAQLPEVAFAIPNHIVVEVVVDALVPDDGDALMTLAILTIEDW